LLLLNPSKAHFLFMNLPLEHHLYFPNSCWYISLCLP
jgi:hypothetical protein